MLLRLSLVVASLVITVFHRVSLLHCTQRVSPTSYQTIPSSPGYDGTFMLDTTVDGCELLTDQKTLQCDYSIVLGDGVRESRPFPMEYISIQNKTFIDFNLTGEAFGVTAISLNFFNDPAGRRVSLLETEVLSGPDLQSLESVQITITDNQYLSQRDAQTRASTLLPLTPLEPHTYVRVIFGSTEFHDFAWMLLSEVVFCVDSQPLLSPQEILFEVPACNSVQPSADSLREISIELVCTVSSQGLYTWQWEKDNSMIGNGDFNYDITIGDGTRTTKLVIFNLDFNDTGEYKCIAILNSFNITAFRIYHLFSEIVSLASPMSSYNNGENITLTCELHGYQSSFSPPVWLNTSGNEINSSDKDKYTISSSDGVNTIVLEDGTTLPSVVVSLTIHSLTSADEGDYTCRGTRGESVIEITVIPLFPPSKLTTSANILSTTTQPTPPSTPAISLPLTTQPTPLSTPAITLPLTTQSSRFTEDNQIAVQCPSFSNSTITLIAAMGTVIVALTVAVTSLLVMVVLLTRRLKSFSTALVRLNMTNPLTPAQWSRNRAYNSETNSLDTEGYERVMEVQGTTIIRNKAYNKTDHWLPMMTRNNVHCQSSLNVSHQPSIVGHSCTADTGEPGEIQLHRNLTANASPGEESSDSSYDDVIVIRNKGANVEQSSDYLEVISDRAKSDTPVVIAGDTLVIGSDDDNEMVLEVIMD